jgi:hypothetical protein
MAKIDHARRSAETRMRRQGVEAVGDLDPVHRLGEPRKRQSKAAMRTESAALIAEFNARRAPNH